MAYRTNYRRRRTMRRPMRRLRRRMRIRRPLTRRSINSHHFKRTFIGEILSSGTSASFAGYSVNLSQLPNYTEFTTLFDQYRINKVVVKFVPSFTQDTIGSTEITPNLQSVIDYNDVTTPTATSELLQYQSYRRTRGNQTHTRVFTPSTLVDISDTASSPKWKQWLSTANATLPHFGLKVALDATVVAGSAYYLPYFTVYLSCRSVK